MPRCRKCNKDWPATMTACPDDGWSFTMEVDATVHPQVTAAAIPTPKPATTPRTTAGSSRARDMGNLATAAPLPEEPPPLGDLVAGAVVGEYKIEKKIGEGGMGAVYAATHPLIGKRAAIKVISAALGTDSSAVNRFVQEARSVNQIGHPNIVDVFAFGALPDGRNYFVMEYLQGVSLAERIQRGSMSLGEAIEILDQVADALEAAHEKQIVHRDLKPDNVYLAAVRGGRTMVKLLDFGIAKLSVPDGPGTGGGVAKTRTGMMMGTPGYLSPEQARGKNVDHRTDIYALGCMTFEIVCGRLPFIADNAMDIVLAHMTEPPVRASSIWAEIPEPLDALIARMLEKDAAARPTLSEVRAVFSELVTSGLVTLDNGRGVAFGSGIGRLATPGGGTPMRSTPAGGVLAIGTQPSAAAPGTTPPGAAVVPATQPPVPAKKRTGLYVAIAAVGALGLGGGVFLAMQSGKGEAPQDKPVVATAEPPKSEPPRPVAEPPPPVVETPKPVVEAPDPAPATIEIALNVDNATVTVDGKPAEVTGKKAKAIVDTEGNHLIAIAAAGREPYEATVATKAGETVKHPVRLERAKKATVAKTGPAPAGTGTPKTTTTTTTTTAPAAGSAAKPPDKPPVDKNAPIDPFAP
jgi:serine/threonine-protein kinase